MLASLKDMLPKRGQWTPLIPIVVRMFILYLWASEPISRGLDYVTGDGPNVTRSLSAIEAALPLHVWGLFCLTGGGMIVIGFTGRWRLVAIAGLHICGVTYFGLAVGLTEQVWGRGGDGFRTPWMFFVFALTFWAAAIGYAAAPRKDRLVVIDGDDPEVKSLDGDPAPHNR